MVNLSGSGHGRATGGLFQGQTKEREGKTACFPLSSFVMPGFPDTNLAVPILTVFGDGCCSLLFGELYSWP